MLLCTTKYFLEFGPAALLQRPDAAYAALATPGRRAPAGAVLLAITVLGGACYGAAVGAYVGGPQIAITAGKVPLLFVLTWTLAGPALVVLGALLRASLAPGETLAVALVSIAQTNVLLAAWSPVVLLWSVSLPLWDPPSYGALVLLAVWCVGSSGLASLACLARALARRGLTRARRARVLAAWLAAYAFTGVQVCWVFRPYVGSSADVIPTDKNFFEAVALHADTLRRLLDAWLATPGGSP